MAKNKPKKKSVKVLVKGCKNIPDGVYESCDLDLVLNRRDPMPGDGSGGIGDTIDGLLKPNSQSWYNRNLNSLNKQMSKDDVLWWWLLFIMFALYCVADHYYPYP